MYENELEDVQKSFETRSQFRLNASGCLLQLSEEIAKIVSDGNVKDLPSKALKKLVKLQNNVHGRINTIHKREAQDKQDTKKIKKTIAQLQKKSKLTPTDMKRLKTIETERAQEFVEKKEQSDMMLKFRVYENEMQVRMLKKQKAKIALMKKKIADEEVKQIKENIIPEKETVRRNVENAKRERLESFQKEIEKKKIEDAAHWYPEETEPQEEVKESLVENIGEPEPIVEVIPKLVEEIASTPEPEIVEEMKVQSVNMEIPEEETDAQEPVLEQTETEAKPQPASAGVEIKIQPPKKQTQRFQHPAFTVPHVSRGIFGSVMRPKFGETSGLLTRQQRELKRLERATYHNVLSSTKNKS